MIDHLIDDPKDIESFEISSFQFTLSVKISWLSGYLTLLPSGESADETLTWTTSQLMKKNPSSAFIC